MIREFSIKNYKSILDLKVELGRINLFIGENGCGKTNILEAMAMAAAAVSDRLDNEELYLRGVRVAKPAITLSSFAGVKQGQEIELGWAFEGDARPDLGRATLRLAPEPDGGTGHKWTKLERKPTEKARRTNVPDPEPDPESLARFNEISEQIIAGHSVSEEALEFVLRQVKRQWRGIGKEARRQFFSLNAALAGFLERAGDFLIYNANQLALRGLMNISRKEPLGIHGENLDVAIASLGDEGLKDLLARSALIRWVERIFTDPEDKLKFEGYKLGRSTSTLYFRDRFMRKRANIFSAENANEGILHALFYLTLFISDRTPRTFGIDNIETALNPRLCRNLIKQLTELSKSHGKQALITTHNPAALDGLDLHDDEQRLFVVSRNDAGHTVASRIKLKPPAKDKEPRLMLSEMWMRGHLGGIPLEF